MDRLQRCIRNLFWHDEYEIYLQNPSANARDMGSVLGLGIFPAGKNGNPFQYSCLEKPMDRGALQAIVHGAAKESDDLASKQ